MDNFLTIVLYYGDCPTIIIYSYYIDITLISIFIDHTVIYNCNFAQITWQIGIEFWQCLIKSFKCHHDFIRGILCQFVVVRLKNAF